MSAAPAAAYIYDAERDAPRVRRLLLANLAADERRGAIDLCRFMTSANDGTVGALRLWDGPDGGLRAFAWAFAGFTEVVGDVRDRTVEGDVLAWAEARARDAGQTHHATVADDQDVWRIDLLRGRGYARTDSAAYYLARPLDAPILPADLPGGYTLASLGDTPEAREERALAQTAALPWAPLDAAGVAAVTRSAAYRRDLDLHAVAPDGSLAAFATFWLDEETRLGALDPVGTTEGHQGRGLAAALVAEGLRRLRGLGARQVIAGNGPVREPPEAPGAARRLYARAGFVETGRAPVWSKPR